VDTELEVVVLPVSDVVQMTPPGSPASVIFGQGVTAAAGSLRGLVPAVDAIEQARAQLAEQGADVSEVWHDADGIFYPGGGRKRVSGPDPERRTCASFASFTDPDGNSFVLQAATARLPGRLCSDFGRDVAGLAALLRDAEEHHGRYEPTAPKDHWSDWHAADIVARRLGRSEDDAYREASAALEAAPR
jgi:hypothetical protein